jgi:hypothetical protein
LAMIREMPDRLTLAFSAEAAKLALAKLEL